MTSAPNPEPLPSIPARIADCEAALGDIDEAIAMAEITLRMQDDDQWPPFATTDGGKHLTATIAELRLARIDVVRDLVELRAGVVRPDFVTLAETTRQNVVVTGQFAAVAVRERAKH